MQEILMYLRKSRADGETTIEQVLEKHETILQDYARQEYGHSIPDRSIYREVVSGETIADRPMLRQLLALLETGTVSGVLVVDPQRLTRGDLSDCGQIVNAFRYTDTKVITPTKTYDLSEKFDRKFFEMELMRGNDYLEYTKEILNRGRIASVKKGHFLGSQAPYGYRRVFLDPEHRRAPTLEPDPAEAPAVKLVFDLFVNKGYGFQRIAHALDTAGFKPRNTEYWPVPTIRGMVDNPVYIGKVRWNWRKGERVMRDGELQKRRPRAPRDTWIVADGIHPPLIDEATFEKALARIGTLPRVKRTVALRNPLSGLIFCAQCGRAMVYKPDHNGESRFICTNQSHCHTRSIPVALVMERVRAALQQAIDDFAVTATKDNSAEVEAHAAAVDSLRRKLSDLDRRETEQYDLVENGIYPRDVFLRRHKQLLDAREAANSALCELLASPPIPVDPQARTRRYSEAIRAIADTDGDQTSTNLLLKQVISRIDYHTAQTTRPGNRWIPPAFDLTITLIF